MISLWQRLGEAQRMHSTTSLKNADSDSGRCFRAFSKPRS